MKALNRKNGVTLTVLGISIVIMVILASTIVINVGNSITDTRKTVFAEDLRTIEDSVSVYYIQNDTIPSIGEVLSEKEIYDIVGSEKLINFKEELVINKDNNENIDMGAFYKVDLTKLDISVTNKGNLSKGQSDIYVVSYPSLNVYYLAGISADATNYFSLGRLTSLNNVGNDENFDDSSNVKIQTVNGITVKKQVKTWTNNANILIQTNISDDESLYLSIKDGERRKIETITGNNILSFGNLEEIKNKKSSLKADITASDVEYFNNLPQSEKIITILKEKNGNIVSQVKVDLSNYENILPVISNVQNSDNENYNILEFNVSDNISGIKNVYYEYLEYYNKDMIKKSYYIDVFEYDFSYMRTRAKKIDVSENGTYQIKVPKNITKVQIMALDNASNYVSIIKDISNNIYLDITEKNIVNKNISFKFTILSEIEIENVTSYISTNGIDFENEQNVELLNEESKITGNVIYNDILTTKEDIYVKIIVRSKENKEYIRIINLKDIENIYS